MPYLPILSRTLLYERLRDGSLRLLDFHLVNTTLGTMIEPRTLVRGGGTNEDPYDGGYTDVLQVDLTVTSLFPGIMTHQWPRDYQTSAAPPAVRPTRH